MRCDSFYGGRCSIHVFIPVLVASLLTSCLGPVSVFCPSGMICPEGQACAASQAVCIKTPCGDGVVAIGEVCDDGNILDGDGCSHNCLSSESCGNGVLDYGLGERCDDKNLQDGDGCSANCRSDETCGNQVVDTVKQEVCDDGNNLGQDGCSADCLSGESCGNGTREPGEECDDGNKSNEDDCGNSCLIARCGDGLVDRQGPGVEACDTTGNSRNCDADCTPAVCGDGFRNSEANEQCDTAGNSFTCDADCSPPVCGDGFANLAANERCDDGNDSNKDNCLNTCERNVCGDGFHNEAVKDDGKMVEACDDGNTVTETSCDYNERECQRCSNGCSSVLNLEGPYCGDGTKNGAEVCDDGNNYTETGCPYGTRNCTACDATCGKVLNLSGPFCGDGVVYTNGPEEVNESCDDGNNDSCGTCSSTCTKVRLSKASGRISVMSYINVQDGSRFTLNDGLGGVVTFEFDENGAHSSGSMLIKFSGIASNEAMALAIKAAIAGASSKLQIEASVLDGSKSTVNLVHKRDGMFGNQSISSSGLVIGTLLIDGMKDGAGANCDEGIGCRRNEDCAPNLVCKDDDHTCGSP
jgi:cysteine-rich repeat protein